MFFVLAKILGFFAVPSNILIILGLLGIVRMRTGFARAGRRFVVTSLVLLAVMGLPPVGNALILPLEQRFPAWNEAGRPPDGMVVLGVSFDTPVAEARGEVALTDAAERMTVVAELARRFPDARILFSGGSRRLGFQDVLESDLAARMFANFRICQSGINM